MPRCENTLQARLAVKEATSHGLVSSSLPAKVINLSETGCCLALPTLSLEGFHLQRCLNAGDDYLLEIEIRSPQGGAWVVLAEARWSNRDWGQEEFPFRVGARFVGPVALPANWRRILFVRS